MKIAVPKEIKNHEYRVALTPTGARELVARGHRVTVQAGAFNGSPGVPAGPATAPAASGASRSQAWPTPSVRWSPSPALSVSIWLKAPLLPPARHAPAACTKPAPRTTMPSPPFGGGEKAPSIWLLPPLPPVKMPP